MISILGIQLMISPPFIMKILLYKLYNTLLSSEILHFSFFKIWTKSKEEKKEKEKEEEREKLIQMHLSGQWNAW